MMTTLAAVALVILAAALPGPVQAAKPKACDVAFFHTFDGNAYASIDGVTNRDGVTGYYREGDVISLRPGTYRFEWDDLTLEDVVVAPCDPAPAVAPAARPKPSTVSKPPAPAVRPKPRPAAIVAVPIVRPHVRHIPHRPERVG